MLGELKIKRAESVRKQITDFLRGAILRGDLPAGSQLPSTQELTRRWETTQSNAHYALSALVKEGLVTRTPRVGTTVNPIDRKLETVAVYLKHGSWAGLTQFAGLLLDLLDAELRGRGVECVVLNDTGGDSGLKRLELLAAERRVQAVVSPWIDRPSLDRLDALPTPFSCLGSERRANGVSVLDDSLVEKAVEGLRRQGCRKAGLLCSMAAGPEPERRRFFERFRTLALENDMETRGEWQRVAPAGSVPGQYERLGFAHRNVHELWTLPERPDGLFVYTDDLIQGTLLAIAELGTRVPEDMKLVFHRNLELPVFCPAPCAFVEGSVATLAKRLVDVADDLFHGRQPDQGRCQYQLKFHKG